MTDLTPAPARVLQQVTEYIESERRNWEKWENRGPLDSTGVYDLHTLARAIYAAGWTDGYIAAHEVSRGEPK